MIEKEVHICPILMCAVLWENGKCMENCNKGVSDSIDRKQKEKA